MASNPKRPDRNGPHESVYRRNRAMIMKSQDICGICGQPIDPALKYPHPMSKSLDHIIPIDRGGHPFDKANMQVAHLQCNRMKGARLQKNPKPDLLSSQAPHNNRALPQSRDWRNYKIERWE